MKVCVVSYCDKMVGVQNCSNSMKMNDFFFLLFSNVTGDFVLVHQEFFFL